MAQIETPITVHCTTCGSDDVLRDAFAERDVELQTWELSTVFDDWTCNVCEGSTSVEERPCVEAEQ